MDDQNQTQQPASPDAPASPNRGESQGGPVGDQGGVPTPPAEPIVVPPAPTVPPAQVPMPEPQPTADQPQVETPAVQPAPDPQAPQPGTDTN